MRSVLSRTTTCCTVPVAARGRCSVNIGLSAQLRSNSFGLLGAVSSSQPCVWNKVTKPSVPVSTAANEACRRSRSMKATRVPCTAPDGPTRQRPTGQRQRPVASCSTRPIPSTPPAAALRGGSAALRSGAQARAALAAPGGWVSVPVASCMRPWASSSMKPRTMPSPATSSVRRCCSSAWPAREASGTAATRALPSLTARSTRRKFCRTTSSSSRAKFAVLRSSSRIAMARSR